MQFVTTLVTLVTFACVAAEWKAFCRQHGGYGTFCKDDLSGYRKCGGSWWGRRKQLEDKGCPPGTRCSCFLGNDCDIMVHVGELADYKGFNADICQRYTMAYPLKEVIHLKYNKSGWKDGDTDEDYLEYKENGEIKQDLRKESVRHTWTVNKKRYFKLIIPDEKGAFIKFSGHYPNTCKKTAVKVFEELGEKIKYYHLDKRKSKTLDSRFEEQVWYNTVFNNNMVPGLQRRWTVIADMVNKRITPVRYYDTYMGTQEEQCCGHEETTAYREVLFDISGSTSVWFDIPNFCP